MWFKRLMEGLAFVLRELFGPVFKQWREPPEVREVGGDEELKKDIDDDIDDANLGK